ncbi:hypothetical protein Dtox_2138 [Desulfofarcimen acetoxidans DSM 771]|uniref:Uncharacterized protein n=1 Tax=Desulfofarcimen acetoxidans (strain ATCC 49208 / DSM 771 / KCTC 5769 / VKM B-1644 / 5575) TaxID=485916 RepID=C8VZ56_DESAS|nr:hypothetical protein [Desulfofarcimen acetoxidans]ACV62966.1 hypothetical protein Dtox_2138 [Desulfofarcimen acetoxidans DSM 771]
MSKRSPVYKQLTGELNKEKKRCILEENKICDDCCECFVCELDPTKICDNCAKCLGINELYEFDQVDDFIFIEDEDECI